MPSPNEQPNLIQEPWPTEDTLFPVAPELEATTISAPSKTRNRPSSVTNHQKELVKIFEHLAAGRHSRWEVFADFCEMAATAFSNKVDLAQYDVREANYMKIIGKYDRAEVALFPQAIGELIEALEQNFGDVLGRTFHDLELHNKYAGQFFTPYDVSRMMAKMTIGDGDDLRERIARRGYVTTMEPAVGSGAMVIALAEAMREAGINYQEHLHVRAVDIDLKCVHMAYVQFSLLGIPAIITHGNSLALKEYSHWHTPMHVIGGWNEKFQRQAMIEKMLELMTAPPPAPVVVADPPAVEESSVEMPRFPASQLTLF
jgi:N-6 DNA Methylase